MADEQTREENQALKEEITLTPGSEASEQPIEATGAKVSQAPAAPAGAMASPMRADDPVSAVHASDQLSETQITESPRGHSEPPSRDDDRHTLPYNASPVAMGEPRRSSFPPAKGVTGSYKQSTLREKFKSKSFAEEWQEAMGSVVPNEEPVLDLSDEMELEPEDEKDASTAGLGERPVFGGTLARPDAAWPEAISNKTVEPDLSSIVRIGAERIPVLDDDHFEELTDADVDKSGSAEEISIVEEVTIEELTDADVDAKETVPTIPPVDEMHIEKVSDREGKTSLDADKGSSGISPADLVRVNAHSEEDEEEEEIDLAEAEEVSTTIPPRTPFPVIEGRDNALSAPPPAPTTNDGRKPRIRRRGKHTQEWWARIFNDDYVSTIPKATVRGDQRKVNFIEKNLAVPANSLVLDLACGNGRHSVGMAKRGYRVVGIDLSLPMLAQAAELAQDERQNINFIHGDMRDLNFDRTFDGIFCMGTSFGYFDDQTNYRVLLGVARSLKPGGSFLIEVANRDHVIMKMPDLTWFEGNGSVCMEESSFDFVTSRIIVMRQLIMDGGRQVQNDISIRLYSLHELEEMLTRSGFTITAISGHQATPGAFFGPDSVRILISCKRNR